MDATELVSQLRRRHEKSTQASSATLVATIDAINETLQSNNMSKTFVSYLGACMSAMTRVSSSEESVTLTALCALLAAVIPNVPKQYTRSKFSMMVSTLCTAISLLDEADAGTGVKWAVQALSHVLAAPDLEGTWASASSGFIFLVKMTMDGHPKSRRAAHEGLAMVMEAYPGTAAHQPASQELADIAKVVLAAPKLAAKAASEATKSTREAAEEVIVAAVQDCLHLLGALKLVLPSLTEAAKLQICDHVLAMLILNQPLLTMHGTECLIRAVQGSSSGSEALPAAKVQQLLSAALQQLDSQKSPDNIASVLRLLEEGLQSLRRRSTGACAQALPSAVSHIAPLLAAESDSVRHAAATTLVALLRSCVSEEMVAADALDTARAGGRPGGLQRVMAALTGMLGASYRDAWPGVMRVLAAAFEALGEPGQHLVEPALARLADMCRGSADAEEYASLAHAAVGASIAAQGPHAVLAVASLDMSDLAACDTWVIPLLRKHAVGTQMVFWGEFMLPRARLIGSMSARARHLGHASDHVKLAALELQMWNTLASFARWAVDIPAAFAAFGETLGAAFQRRPDLQAPICNVLRRVCGDTCAALRAFSVTDGAGYGDAEEGAAAGGDAATSVFALRVGPGLEEVPGTFTEEMALGNREAVRGVAQKWLTELLNRYVKLPPESRGGVGETVAAVAAVAGEALAGPFFKEALSKVIASLQSIQGGEEVVLGDPEADVCTFLEVAVLLAPGLRDSAMAPLFKAARLVLALKKPAPQKKAYKALAYLFTQRSAMLDAHAADAVAVLLDSAGVDAAAKRHRLRCILPVILLLARAERGGGPEGAGVKDSPAQSARLVTELVLGIKEVNTKTRMEAYGVLVRTAHALHEAQPPQHSLTEPASASSLTNGGLQRFFSSILAGVASHTPRMVSAAVMALARLTFEFAPELQVIAAELLPPVCTLLQSKAREVIKAALGFLKVVALRVPADLVTPHLPLIIEGVLVWAEDSKNKFKLKVRRLVERLCKRCGYEAVAAAWPEAHQKLLTAVRKGMARSVRQKSRGADSEGSEGGASAASGARTARASEWGHSGIFSDDDVGGGEDGDARSRAGMSTKSKQGKGSRAPTDKAAGRANGKTRSRLADDEGNPVDLLDGSTARALVRSAARGAEDDEAAVEFERNPLGKLVFREEEEEDVMASPRRRKRKRGGDVDSDDSDLEDLKGIAGLSGALKATRNAESLKGAAKYAHSHKSGASRKSRASAASGGARGDRVALHTGAKFKSKKAAGDSQRGSKVEPYAYWRLDKNLLNSRKAKSRGAKSTLGGVIKTDAPAKGRKAKKRRAAE